MNRDPMTKQRSPWVYHEEDTKWFRKVGVEPDAKVYRRNVHDGRLISIVGVIPHQGLHLSITHKKHDGEVGRYPTWDEIAHARDELLPSDLGFSMALPPTDGDDYVAVYPTTFHLHQDRGHDEIDIAGIRWRVLFGTDAEGKVSKDGAGRIIARLQPSDMEDSDDTYLADWTATPTEEDDT